MNVVGGVYIEDCVSPRVAGLVGPGLRAAMTLRGLSSHAHLHTIAAQGQAEDIRATCNSCGIDVTFHQPPGGSTEPICFWYNNALSPVVPQLAGTTRGSVHVEGDHILLLGFLEAGVSVSGHSVVYEPEPETRRNLFTDNSSHADRLALVLKASSFREITRQRRIPDAARSLLGETGAEVLVIRSELGSAVVFQGDYPPRIIGGYETQRWHRLGMGNVFSATFAHHWIERKANAEEAARAACLAMAQYNEDGGLSFPFSPRTDRAEAPDLHVPLDGSSLLPRVRLEGCNGRYVERHLFNDAANALKAMLLEVETRIPLWDVDPIPIVDDEFRALLLLTDFADRDAFDHAMKAAAAGKPVISYSEYPRYDAASLEALPGVECIDDFTTAIYRTAVAARRTALSGPP